MTASAEPTHKFVVVEGPIGVGKTSLSRGLASSLGAETLLERIAKRGISYEQHIERQYLERLNEAYARFFHEFEAAPLLIVNAAAIDPINNQGDYDELLTAIKRMKRGRLYYNPLRSRSL